MALGDDFDGAVGHFDGGVVVDRIGRIRDRGRPSLCLVHRVFRQVRVVDVREDREVDDAAWENGGKDRVFTHEPGANPKLASRLERTPWMDSITLDIALAGVRARGLGKRADARQPDAEVERSPAFSSYGWCFSQVQTSQPQLTSVFSDSGSKIWSLSIGTAS